MPTIAVDDKGLGWTMQGVVQRSEITSKDNGRLYSKANGQRPLLMHCVYTKLSILIWTIGGMDKGPCTINGSC